MKKKFPVGVQVVRIHRNHYVVIDSSKAPVKRLFESYVRFGVCTHNPKITCENWLGDNGYRPSGEIWVKA